jgi:hypothetical protein
MGKKSPNLVTLVVLAKVRKEGIVVVRYNKCFAINFANGNTT